MLGSGVCFDDPSHAMVVFKVRVKNKLDKSMFSK